MGRRTWENTTRECVFFPLRLQFSKSIVSSVAAFMAKWTVQHSGRTVVVVGMLASHSNLTPTSLFFSAFLHPLSSCVSILRLLSPCLLHKRHISIMFTDQKAPAQTAEQLCCWQISTAFKVRKVSTIRSKLPRRRSSGFFGWTLSDLFHRAFVTIGKKIFHFQAPDK